MRVLSFLVAGAAAFTLSACQQAPAPEVQLGNTPAEDLDPFVVMIGAERWTVLLEHALNGAREAPEGPAAAGYDDLYRTDSALKRGAAMVIELRNSVCSKQLVTGADCTLPDWPAWTLEPPNGNTPLTELDRRSGWLDLVMAPFVEAGCEAGRKASGERMFCSVE